MGDRNDILHALDAFVRKYYKNLLIRGLLCAVAIMAGLYVCAVLVEHVGWLPKAARAAIFWGGTAVAAAVTGWMVVRPLLKMLGLSKRRLSHAEAANIIGHHFPEVSDKLLNLLQLMEGNSESDLLVAAIEQKTAQLKPVPFLKAISLKANRKYLKYALPPLVLLAVLLIAAPQVVSGPTHRIVNYRTAFERPAPFRFVVKNERLCAAQGDDVELMVGTEGEARPAEVTVVVDGHPFRMTRNGDLFSYKFRKLNRSHTFHMEGGSVTSPDYRLEMIPNPTLLSFTMHLAYPPYTGRQAETLVDLGDAAVPEGTVIRWSFQTQDAESMTFVFDSTDKVELPLESSGRTGIQRRAMHTMEYALCAGGHGRTSDTLRYLLTAIADAAPQIEVEEMIDSAQPDRRLFRGSIKDDYGFSRLLFRHTSGFETDSAQHAGEADIALGEGASQDFYFSFNTAELNLRAGEGVDYWFEVSDNDAIHGPKTTQSRHFQIKVPTEAELDRQLAQNSAEAQQKAQASMSELKQMQEEIDEMMRRMVDKKELSWQDKKDLERIAEKQREIRQMMQQMRQQIEENNRLEQKYREQSQQLMEKQRELDRLMNEVMDEKMKETMAELDRMMQELDKKKVQQELEQLKTNNSDLEKQIDQNLELMRRLEIEKRVEQTIEKMDRLAEEQRALGKETEQAKKNDREALQQKQQEMTDRFEQLRQDLKEISQDYKQLETPVNFNVPDSLQQQVSQQQQEAQKNMDRGKQKEASKQQRQAADDMEQLSEQIAQAQAEAEEENLAEDAEQVRQLLKSLVGLSKNQEELIGQVNQTYIQDPRYQQIIASQNRIKDDFRNVEDSLRAMSKRQIQVASAVAKELGSVNSNISTSLDGLLNMNQSFYGTNRNTGAARSMQYSMTSLNNLALVLAESLDKMQDQMRQNSQKRNSKQRNSKSSQQCNNPGQKPSPKSMRQMQQELNKQMEALKKQLDKQGKPQQRHQLGQQNGMSEQFSKMAAQQEMIRRMMQEYGQEMKEQSGGNGKLAREIDQMLKQMEQTETDLVNRTITRQTLQRQQQIMTRLLEHEKADMQREREERRESHEGSELYSQPSPAELEKYNKARQQGTDLLQSVPPSLTPYYRDKVNDYFYGL